jgi:hypothetical protein
MTPYQETAMRSCPFCKEDVKPDAVRCKHCHAAIPVEKPGHQGVCPFCKEDIKPEAIRCKHCQADLAAKQASCCDECSQQRREPGIRKAIAQATPPGVMRTEPLLRKAIPRDPLRRGVTRVPSACPTCLDYDIDDYGTWCFEYCDDTYCYMYLCAVVA